MYNSYLSNTTNFTVQVITKKMCYNFYVLAEFSYQRCTLNFSILVYVQCFGDTQISTSRKVWYFLQKRNKIYSWAETFLFTCLHYYSDFGQWNYDSLTKSEKTTLCIIPLIIPHYVTSKKNGAKFFGRLSICASRHIQPSVLFRTPIIFFNIDLVLMNP